MAIETIIHGSDLELHDMQGILIRGYGALPEAKYLLLGFEDRKLAKSYLKDMHLLITNGLVKPKDQAMNFALTASGIKTLGINEEDFSTFLREFKEGMTEPHRQFVLGDKGEFSAGNWDWGQPGGEKVDLLLMVFAKDHELMEKILDREKERMERFGVKLLHSLPTALLQDHKEHFGFRDDISQPRIKELAKTYQEGDFPAGEFFLGYRDLYDEYPLSPSVAEQEDSMDLLPISYENKQRKDLGKNGSYLVFRQMQQDVVAFWEYMKTKTISEEEAILLASKMVGRWPDGSPLTLCPDGPNMDLSQENDFNFWKEDKLGLKCPIGAHIRRTNPRDHLVTETNAKDSKEMAGKHRMLRKGRPYGKPLEADIDPLKMMMKADDGEERGLHFICLVTDIRRQFEFVQNSWVNFHKFGGLDQDADPIIGNHYQEGNLKTDEFSVPQFPVRKKYEKLPNFTKVRGGAYFFVPGMRAMKFLSKALE
ncbi:Dyp-type peroxidase [Pleomorphovibrio marinus]|uniref:Dyp-type peroxidase n=1 Tax=Pleomorphovibrio marinus TaxID=2164132 RepID=UPI001E3324F5|nr:Dyp-type peroxidase [Pleomorphovibrio marinus]